jgi:acetoacetyl-CoA synthetase
VSVVTATGTVLPEGECLWTPPDDVLTTTRLGQFMSWLAETRALEFDDYDALWRWSVDDLDGFWSAIWDYFGIVAHAEPEAVLASRAMPGAEWFPGARLNYAEHALRHGADDEVAILARSQTREDVQLTWGRLRQEVGRVQAGLRRLGVGPGDRVAAYLPNTPEAVVALLATAGLGATWAACPPEFGARGALDRLRQFDPHVLLAVDGYRWGAKEVDRRADVVRLRDGLPSLRATVLLPYLSDDRITGTTSWSELAAEEAPAEFWPAPFDHPLWVLFSSGTTGLPKPLVHGHGGIVLEQLKALALLHDLGPGDRLFFFSTTGWMVWNQVVSTLLTGAGIVVLDGDPLYAQVDALWQLASQLGVTHFGASASFYALCRQAALEPAKAHDLSALRYVKSAGSPLPSEGYRWLAAQFPDVYFSSSSGGTEICSGFVGGVPILPVRSGEMAGRWLGVRAEAWDEEGRPVIDEPGELVITAPLPSMPLYLLGDPAGERYRAEYFARYPGVWRHGDSFVVSGRGTCAVLGRSDATLNRGGVRLGTAEFYAVVETFPEVRDSLVVHLEDADGGLGSLLLLVELHGEGALDDDLTGRLTLALRSELSPRHAPDEIVAVPALPRGATGKRLEIPIKRILKGADPAAVIDRESLPNPAALDAFLAATTPWRTHA